MKLFKCLRWAILGSVLVTAAASEARSAFLYGACQDSSQNLYTASYYPNSAKLRVSKRSATNTGIWVKDFTPPSGFKYQGNQIVRTDASGNVYVATTLYNATTTVAEYQILKITSAGALSVSKVYAPATAGQSINLAGLVLDPSGNVYFAGTYDFSGTPVGFIVKYNSSLASGVARGISIPSYNIFVDDLVADGSGNVYVSAYGSTGSAQLSSTVCKWDSTFGSSPVWQQIYYMPATALPSQEGCLTIDSSNRLTYTGTYADANNAYHTNVYAIQYSSTGTQNWVNSPSLVDMTAYWSMADSSGDVVVTGTSSATTYQIAKFNGTTGALTWSTSRAANAVSPTLCQDASGDYLVVTIQTLSGIAKSVVDRFTGSTGAYSTTYTYSSGASGADYGERVFPSGTAGTFFVFGVGLSGGSYYPLCYRAGTGTWVAYQTATTP